jgi:hypothetical protein
MDELISSGIKLAYPPEYNFMVENADETILSKVKGNRVNCPSYEVCVNWSKNQKNVSFLMEDIMFEQNYALGDYVGENSESLLCRLEDGVVFNTGRSMIMNNGDPLLERVKEIIDHVVEAGIYNFWISLQMDFIKTQSRKIAIVHPLDGYYSFNLYHMQPAFYLLLMGWCLSSVSFVIELLCNCVLKKRL